MTAAEVYELTTDGGATDLARLIATCESFGPYCLINDLAVDCYVEPVYTLDADLVVIAGNFPALADRLQADGFRSEQHPYSLNVFPPGSNLRIQFTRDARYQEFLPRSQPAEVLGVPTRVACVEDVARGKLWAYSDPARRLSKRKKDELDLIRLGEAYPELRSFYPREIIDQLDRG
ncbi:MAG TPA: hypothetical protein VH639_01255 [Bryobacteraceae bacterium]|jgi:hypothetical protein